MGILPSAFALPDDIPVRLERVERAAPRATVTDAQMFEGYDWSYVITDEPVDGKVVHVVTEEDCRQPKVSVIDLGWWVVSGGDVHFFTAE